MPEAKNSDTIGGSLPPKRRDRRLTRKFSQQLKSGKSLNYKQLQRLHNVVNRSDAAGTLNNRDRKFLRKFVSRIENQGLEKAVGTRNMGKLEKAYNAANGLAGFAASGSKGNPFLKEFKTNLNPAGYSKSPSKGKTSPVGNNRPAVGKGGRSSNGGKGGKGGGGGGGMKYFGLGQPPAGSRKFAAGMVQGDINELTLKLLNQIKGAGTDAQFDINQINALHDRTKGDLEYIFGEAKDYIGGQGNLINQRYDETKQGLGSSYDQFVKQAASQALANRGNAAAEMQRLGIADAGLGQFDADMSNNQQVAGINQQNALANLNAMQSSSGEVGNLLNSMTQGSLASSLGRATNARQDSISQTRQEYRQFAQGLLNSIAEAQAAKGNRVNELFLTMRDSDRNFWLDRNQAEFQNQLATNQFNLDRSSLNSRNLWEKAALAQKAAEARQQKKYLQNQQAVYGAINNVMGTVGNIWNGLS